MIGFTYPVDDLSAFQRPMPAIYRPAPAAGGHLPYFGGGGTGGIESACFYMSRIAGYSPSTILIIVQPAPAISFVDLMKEVKIGFGRTLSHLPAAFGVSRQTLYNWLNGEMPKGQHQSKLIELAAAARVFTESGFKPTALSLDRTVLQAKSFLELIKQGADGKEIAERLVRIERRGAATREKLDVILSGRTPLRPTVSDVGLEVPNEDA